MPQATFPYTFIHGTHGCGNESRNVLKWELYCAAGLFCCTCFMTISQLVSSTCKPNPAV